MNGIISRASLRFTLLASTCLLTGFVSGANFHGLNFIDLFPKQEISFSKISWVSSVFDAKNVSLATIDYPASDLANQEIKLAEFHLPAKTISTEKVVLHHQNLQKLTAVLAELKSYDLFKDYRTASLKMHERFLYVMNLPLSAPAAESVVIAASSAQQVESVPAIASEPTTPTKQLIHKTISVKMNTRKLSIHKYHAASIPKAAVVSNREEIQPSTILQEPVIQTVQQSVKMVQSSKTEQAEQKLSLSTEEDQQKTTAEKNANQLEDQMLNQHIQNYVAAKTPKTPQVYVAKKEVQQTPPTTHDEVDHNNDVEPAEPEHSIAPSAKSCDVLPKLHLLKPTQNEATENTQICPEHNQWISKSWGDQGWAKVETSGYFPLITYYPQSNTDSALLLDQNSVALLAIKSGIHYEHGMGIILGLLPTGYKIEFSGRSEEVQYFDLNNKKYFVVLNVEPGAGVTELISEKNQTENATVFTPVLGDTITYLDLVAPVTRDIAVKVVKDSDVGGLTVGISTQTQTQAITQANGSAVLRNVRLVPGFPIFVDVSSKMNSEKSYQYRYQLKKRTRDGVFVLKQYPEKEIFQWLRQIKTGLSEQSAMIFGEFNRKRLDGFKKNYTVRLDSLTEKFGLVAKNYTVLWNEKLSDQDPLEGDRPRFLSVQVPEGLAQAHLINENNQIIQTSLIPVSPRVINVISE